MHAASSAGHTANNQCLCQGTVGRINIKVPWKNLKEKPVTCTVNDMLLLVEPTVKWDVPSQRARTAQKKHQAVAAFSGGQSNQGAAPAEEGAEAEAVRELPEFLRCALDNAQVEVSNIHIRFHDSSAGTSRGDAGCVVVEWLLTAGCARD